MDKSTSKQRIFNIYENIDIDTGEIIKLSKYYKKIREEKKYEKNGNYTLCRITRVYKHSGQTSLFE